MGSIKIYTGFGLATTILVFGFNNCSQVEFEEVLTESSHSELGSELHDDRRSADSDGLASEPPEHLEIAANPSEFEENANDQGVTEQEEDAILANLTPEEIQTLTPISELENDPRLFEKYACLDPAEVMICHFPSNLDATESKCIGHSAVSTHFNHVRSYFEDGAERSIGDYLGPCRH